MQSNRSLDLRKKTPFIPVSPLHSCETRKTQLEENMVLSVEKGHKKEISGAKTVCYLGSIRKAWFLCHSVDLCKETGTSYNSDGSSNCNGLRYNSCFCEHSNRRTQKKRSLCRKTVMTMKTYLLFKKTGCMQMYFFVLVKILVLKCIKPPNYMHTPMQICPADFLQHPLELIQQNDTGLRDIALLQNGQ